MTSATSGRVIDVANATIFSPRLLIVDDDPDAADALADVLRARNFDVKVAHNHEDALQAAESFHPDISLVDFRLQASNGIDLIGRFHALHPDLLCILMTAYAELNLVVQAMRHGAHDFLQKPIDPHLLEAALRRCRELVVLKRAKNQAEHKLVRQEEWLRTALQNMTGGLFVFDQDLVIQVSSPNFSRLFELPETMTEVGRSAVDIIRFRASRGDYGPGEPGVLIENRLSLYRQRENSAVEDSVDENRRIELLLSPMPDGGVVGVFNDITSRKEQERQLQSAMDEIVKATQAKSDFMASMSHELRTPLNSIIGFSELIHKQYLGPVGHEKYLGYAENIVKSGQHLLAMVNDILDIERIESRHYELQFDVIDLPREINKCVLLLADRAERDGILLTVSIAENVPVIEADRRAIFQILINLVTNAIKFSNDGDEVIVRATAANDHHEIQVIDSGIGIAPEKMPTLTDPFTRHDADPHKPQDGVGLGLAISRSLIELHDGRLRFDSQPGRGTVVTVSLPSNRS